MAGQSSAMFGWSWTEVSVLGSQVFGQASMENCEARAIQGSKSRPAYQVVLLSVLLQGVTGVLHSYYTGDTQVLHSCCMGVTRV